MGFFQWYQEEGGRMLEFGRCQLDKQTKQMNYHNICDLCNWPNCEHDYTTSKVNRTPTIKPNCENLLWIWRSFLMTEKFKNQDRPQLMSKNYGITSNKSHFVVVPKSLSHFCYFLVLILFKFFKQNYSIFNNSCVEDLNITKPLWWTLLIKIFPMLPKIQWGCHGLKNLNVTNKTSKLSSFIQSMCLFHYFYYNIQM